jgi:hypothetical protein
MRIICCHLTGYTAPLFFRVKVDKKKGSSAEGSYAEVRKRYKPCPQVAQKIKNILCEMRSTRTYSSVSYLFPLWERFPFCQLSLLLFLGNFFSRCVAAHSSFATVAPTWSKKNY